MSTASDTTQDKMPPTVQQ